MRIYSPRESAELFHLLLLDLLGRKVDKRHYALKGGCNLRFFLQSFRYSNDIDLDVSTALSKDRLQDTLNQIIGSNPLKQLLDHRDIRIQGWSSPKQTDTTQRWKFALTVSQSRVPLHTKVEFSRRGMKDGLAFDSVDANLIRTYELAPIMASHYKREAAYVQKVIALATRRETQARDIFDLNLLLTSGVDPTDVKDKYAKNAGQARDNAWTVSYSIFKSQVVSYLHPEYQAQYSSPELWDSMVLRVVEALGGSNQ